MNAARPKPLCLIAHDAVPEGAAPDIQDSLIQAQSVAAALERLGWRTELLSVDLNLQAVAETLATFRPALVFNLVEAPDGKGRLITLAPDLFEALGAPYTGASAEAVAATSNKLRAKRRLAAAGLPTPALFDLDAPASPDDLYIVKSVWEHASVGLDAGAVMRADRVRAGLAERRLRRGGTWFAERFVNGREFNVALLGPAADPVLLPPSEILFTNFPSDRPRIVDYAAKWDSDSPEYRGTQRSFAPADDPELTARLHDLARACWDAFGLSGYARVDLRMDSDERLWILEINANPCIAPDAGFPAAAAEHGLSYDAMIGRIVEAALGMPVAARVANGMA